jgi:hypothetical protein
MKKILFVMAVLFGTSLVSCNCGEGNSNMKDQDTTTVVSDSVPADSVVSDSVA